MRRDEMEKRNTNEQHKQTKHWATKATAHRMAERGSPKEYTHVHKRTSMMAAPRSTSRDHYQAARRRVEKGPREKRKLVGGGGSAR